MNQREAFEKWASNPPMEFCLARHDDTAAWPGNYKDYHVECAWQAWQASRKALVVELPVAFPVCDDKDSAEVYFADDIHKALDAAGVSYK